jgi:hypothetical protein
VNTDTYSGTECPPASRVLPNRDYNIGYPNRYLFELLHVKLAVFIDIMFFNECSDFVSRNLETNHFECLLQLSRRDVTVAIKINLAAKKINTGKSNKMYNQTKQKV